VDEIACLAVDQPMQQLTGIALISIHAKRGMKISSRPIAGTRDAEIAGEAEAHGAMTVLEKPLSSHELLRFVAVSVG